MVAEFPPYDSKRFSNVYGHPAKAVYEDLRTLGPSFSALEALASSQNFLDWLGQISGIKRLLYDPFCFGGGAQENRPGMHLFPHVDFNCHPFEPWHRRINMLLYLNPGWDARWGGCLQLYDETPRGVSALKTILPEFNRCVIFATSEKSWHGVTPVAMPPADFSRKSVSFYFYTRKKPGLSPHSTLWRFPALPARIKSGRRLDAADIEDVNRALFYRDSEIDHLSMRGFHLQWKSPLSADWRPGHVLGPRESAWLKRQIRRKDAWLRILWHGRARGGIQEAVERRKCEPLPPAGA